MNRSQKFQYCVKVFLDKIFSLLLLIILFPLLIIISLLIKIDSKGPIIFKQKRLGKSGKIFWIYKFRTMIDNAESIGDGVYISKNDFRITRIGQILRKTSLDELPQLVNILKSDMSFIGPRPPLINHPYRYIDYSKVDKLRFFVLPGLTGYAQAYGRNTLTWPERIKMDIYYYENFSLLLDLKILVDTIFTVISLKGVYSDQNKKEKLNKANAKNMEV